WADRVTWTGFLPAADVSRYLMAADLAVLPFADGATLRRTSLLAALAHGLPILSTGDRPPTAGVRVVPIGDSHALAAEIDRLSRHPRQLADLAAEARQAAAAFAWPTIAVETARVLDSVIASARA